MADTASTTVRPEWRTATAYITGEILGCSGTIPVLNPANGVRIGDVQAVDGVLTDEAVASANAAFPAWRDLTPVERGAILSEAVDTFVNAHRLGASVPRAPFGGVKQSGIGRTHGLSLHHCTQEHAIAGFSDAAAQLPGIERWINVDDDKDTKGTGRGTHERL
ncbi:hypothetical protein GCM10027416_14140 [Okibacterium endophyticum]